MAWRQPSLAPPPVVPLALRPRTLWPCRRWPRCWGGDPCGPRLTARARGPRAFFWRRPGWLPCAVPSLARRGGGPGRGARAALVRRRPLLRRGRRASRPAPLFADPPHHPHAVCHRATSALHTPPYARSEARARAHSLLPPPCRSLVWTRWASAGSHGRTNAAL